MDIGDKVFIEIGVRQYGRCKVLSRAWAAKKKESRRWKAHGKINNRHIAVRFPAAAIRVETHIFMPGLSSSESTPRIYRMGAL